MTTLLHTPFIYDKKDCNIMLRVEVVIGRKKVEKRKEVV